MLSAGSVSVLLSDSICTHCYPELGYVHSCIIQWDSDDFNNKFPKLLLEIQGQNSVAGNRPITVKLVIEL